jgi:hypothetical protein
MSDEELNRILPSTGYEIVQPPVGYQVKAHATKEEEGFKI